MFFKLFFLLLPICFATISTQNIRFETRKIDGITLNLIYVSRHNPRLSIRPAIPHDGESITALQKRLGAEAMINGTYFYDYKSYTPITDIMIDKKLVHFGGIGTVVSISLSNQLTFHPTKRYRHSNWDHHFTHAMAAGPKLLTDGLITLNPQKEGFKDRRLFQKKIRTAIGTINNDWIVLITTGTRCYLEALCHALQKIGLTHAMNLDGGSSSMMTYNNTLIRLPRTRKISSVIAIKTDDEFWWNRWKAFIYDPTLVN